MLAKKRKFAFLIHARTHHDLGRRIGKVIGIGERRGERFLPTRYLEKGLGYLRGRLSFTICSKFDVRGEVEGFIIGLLMTGPQMMDARSPNFLGSGVVRNRISEAVVFCQEKLGVERVGLGAYTASATGGGLLLARNKDIKCNITHGDSLAAYSAIPAIEKITELTGFNLKHATVAIVGAYGIVGRAVTFLSSELGFGTMILCGPNRQKLNRFATETKNIYSGNVIACSDNKMIDKAEIVILCTSALGTIVGPESFKTDAVVIDLAQPQNMDAEVCEARPDVVRIDGGFISTDGIDLGFNMGPPKGATFACLMETIVLTMIGDKKNHIGIVDTDFAKMIGKKAEDLGFPLAPLTNFSVPIVGVRP